MRVLVFCAVVALLAGCAGPMIFLYGDDVGTMTPIDELRYAAADGRGVLTEINGRAFDIDKATLDRRVLDDIKGANPGSPVNFVATAGPKDRTAYRLVLQFNGTAGQAQQALCQGGGGKETRTGSPVVLSASFCIGERLIATINGQIGTVQGPDDPAFRALIRSVVYNLFELRPDLFDNGDGSGLMRRF